jgi:hypothetical protein
LQRTHWLLGRSISSNIFRNLSLLDDFISNLFENNQLKSQQHYQNLSQYMAKLFLAFEKSNLELRMSEEKGYAYSGTRSEGSICLGP